MNLKKVETAMEEARRFLRRCDDVIDRREKENMGRHCVNIFWGCKETGALRRSSMDLSNALADLRKSQ